MPTEGVDEPKRKGMPVVFFFFFLISAVGSVILVWWALNYQTANEQLWMVPVGLLFFATPVVIGFSILASEIPCCIASQSTEKYTQGVLGSTYPSS